MSEELTSEGPADTGREKKLTKSQAEELRTRIYAMLAAPFDPDELEWRFQSSGKGASSGLMLPYVQSRAIMDRLDVAVGAGMWSDRMRAESTTVTDGKAGMEVKSRSWICTLILQLPGEKNEPVFVEHEDGADETHVEPTKGGISDALKRAAVKFGIGRYLYFLPSVFVDQKPTFKEWAETRRTNRLPNGRPLIPDWALPGGSGRPPQGRGSSAGASEPEAAHGGATQSAPSQAAPAPAPRQPQPQGQQVTRPAPGQNEDPDVPLPPRPPPFNLSEVMKFGTKYKGMAWGYLAQGGPNGDRRSYLRWLVQKRGEFTNRVMFEAAVSAKLLLEWLRDETVAGGGGEGDGGDGPQYDPPPAASSGASYPSVEVDDTPF